MTGRSSDACDRAPEDGRSMVERDDDDVLLHIQNRAHLRKIHDGLVQIMGVSGSTTPAELTLLHSANFLKPGHDGRYELTNAGEQRLKAMSVLSIVPGPVDATPIWSHMGFDVSGVEAKQLSDDRTPSEKHADAVLKAARDGGHIRVVDESLCEVLAHKLTTGVVTLEKLRLQGLIERSVGDQYQTTPAGDQHLDEVARRVG